MDQFEDLLVLGGGGREGRERKRGRGVELPGGGDEDGFYQRESVVRGVELSLEEGREVQLSLVMGGKGRINDLR